MCKLKRKIGFASILLFLFLFVAACTNETDNETGNPPEEKPDVTETPVKEDVSLTVSAAVSLKDAMEVIQKDYNELHPEVTIDFNFGGSGSLQQQISQGAPVDLFFSAAEDKFDLLVEEGLISEEDGTPLLNNELVLIVPKGDSTVKSFEDLAKDDVKQFSIGTPETVPAGKYAQESFEQMGIWDDVENKIVYAKDVRQVLSYVETKNVEAGVVYKTDAISSDQVEMIASADPETHTPIVYPVGVIKDSKQYDAAKEFYTYLQSDEALKVFVEYGFTTQ